MNTFLTATQYGSILSLKRSVSRGTNRRIFILVSEFSATFCLLSKVKVRRAAKNLAADVYIFTGSSPVVTSRR